MPKIRIHEVNLTGYGGSFQSHDGDQAAMLTYKFKTGFNSRVAKQLDCYDDTYKELPPEQDGGEPIVRLRDFTTHGCTIKVDSATLEIKRDPNDKDPVRLEGEVRNFTVTRKDDEVELTFQFRTRLDDLAAIQFASTQKREDISQMTIIGKQTTIFDADPGEPEPDPQQTLTDVA